MRLRKKFDTTLSLINFIKKFNTEKMIEEIKETDLEKIKIALEEAKRTVGINEQNISQLEFQLTYYRIIEKPADHLSSIIVRKPKIEEIFEVKRNLISESNSLLGRKKEVWFLRENLKKLEIQNKKWALQPKQREKQKTIIYNYLIDRQGIITEELAHFYFSKHIISPSKTKVANCVKNKDEDLFSQMIKEFLAETYEEYLIILQFDEHIEKILLESLYKKISNNISK